MFNVGRICMKIAGRDAGNYCVVVEELDYPYVTIDGMTRRRKCNIRHLEALDSTVDVKKGADNSVVLDALKKAGFEIVEKKASSKDKKEKADRPKKQKVKKDKPVKAKQPKAKEVKKETKTEKKTETKPKADTKDSSEKKKE